VRALILSEHVQREIGRLADAAFTRGAHESTVIVVLELSDPYARAIDSKIETDKVRAPNHNVTITSLDKPVFQQVIDVIGKHYPQIALDYAGCTGLCIFGAGYGMFQVAEYHLREAPPSPWGPS